MLVIALPLQLTHELQHSELHIRKYGYFFIAVRFQLQIPYKRVFKFAHKICRGNAQVVPFRLKPCISHTVSDSPSFRFCAARFVRGTPCIVSVLYVCVKAAPVGREMKKSVMIYSPNLRTFIKRHAAARLGQHRMEGNV